MNETEQTRFNKEFLDAARECASYIFDSETEQNSYQSYIEEGNDPRDHILYYAARVLSKDDQFDVDINEYLNLEDQT